MATRSCNCVLKPRMARDKRCAPRRAAKVAAARSERADRSRYLHVPTLAISGPLVAGMV